VYNEEATVIAVLTELDSMMDELVVVDDGSTDATAEALAGWVEGCEHVSVVTLPHNQGVSAAYRVALRGLRCRLEAGELDADDLVFTIDADGQHDLSALEGLRAVTDEESLDAMVACRDLSYQPVVKRWGNHLLSAWASLWAGRRLRDVECGYRILRLGPLLQASRYLRGFRYSQPAQLAVVMSRLGYRLRNDVTVRVPVARSRTRLANAAIHFVAIPWSAVRVSSTQFAHSLTEPDVGSITLARLLAVIAAVISAAAALDVVAQTKMLSGLVFACLAVGAFAFARHRGTGRLARNAAMVLAPLELAIAGLLWGGSAAIGLAALGAGLTGGLLLGGPPRSQRHGTGRVMAVGAVTAWLAAIVWSGANDPAAAWFGQTSSHGSRQTDMVALTFDDGPNDSATLPLVNLLESRGVRGSFFMVGAAMQARPDLVRSVVEHGEVVGNHSFRHGANDWLVPGYPELRRGEQVSVRLLERCPAFFRPPFGRHIPLIADQVDRLGMRMVTWDVSAHDWDAKDPAQITRRVLSRVKPGSIVLLHDGSNGDPTVDRSVVVPAVAGILDGLAGRGLHAVGLDELLGQPAWTTTCPPT
jgi:peptidoglycan/xylan/chitin deacetylase (PgdA/CDA1 family)